MTRALHLHSGNMYGGVETFLATIARTSAGESRVEHHFGICFDGRLAGELRALDAPVHLLGAARLSRPWTVLAVRKRLRQLIQEIQPGVVVMHSAWAQVMFGSVARSSGTPQLFFAHDLIDGRSPLQKIARWTPPDYALCNSEFTQSHFVRVFPQVPARKFFYPVILPPGGGATPDELRQVRDELRTAEDSVAIVQVSRLERYKGHRLHLQGLATIADVPGWTAWFIGGAQRAEEQAYLEELKALANDLGIADRVRFTGQRRDIGRVLQAADIFCQPNAGPEPFGIVFIEAMASGLPVVTTALGGPMEIVDQTSGILTEPGNAASLGTALRKLIVDRSLSERLGAGGPARAEAISNPADKLAEIEMILIELAQNGK